MALNVPVLRQSFDLVVERSPELTLRFYEILFERFPQAQPLFGRNSRKAQSDMLTQALVAVLDHIEDAPWLQSTLGAMGARHADYGVTEEMFGWVGESLLATLAEVAGSDWTAEMEASWAEAFGAIQSMMLAGYPRRAEAPKSARATLSAEV